MFKEIVFDEINEDLRKRLKKDFALVTAGDENDLNTMTVSWGSFGEIWNKSIVTIYIRKSRYTVKYLDKKEYFTLSFYGKEYKKQLGYLGSRSGRDEDKVNAVGFTPVETHNSITFEEAKLTFVCKKLYQHEMDKDNSKVVDFMEKLNPERNK